MLDIFVFFHSFSQFLAGFLGFPFIFTFYCTHWPTSLLPSRPLSFLTFSRFSMPFIEFLSIFLSISSSNFQFPSRSKMLFWNFIFLKIFDSEFTKSGVFVPVPFPFFGDLRFYRLCAFLYFLYEFYENLQNEFAITLSLSFFPFFRCFLIHHHLINFCWTLEMNENQEFSRENKKFWPKNTQIQTPADVGRGNTWPRCLKEHRPRVGLATKTKFLKDFQWIFVVFSSKNV